MQALSEAVEEQRMCAISDWLARRIRSSRQLQANDGKQDRKVTNAQLRDETALDPADLRC
jgi:hypothetical protein